MGNFYTNVTVRAAADEVIAVLRDLRRIAYVAEADGFCVVCDRACERQDLDELASLTLTLSAKLRRSALSVINHDDVLLLFGLFTDGALVTEYGIARGSQFAPPKTSKGAFIRSVHSSFGSQRVERELLLPWWLVPVVARLNLALRHEQLAAELGIPALSVAAGFRYVDQDSIPRGKKSDFVRV